jgi:hypothetical protein
MAADSSAGGSLIVTTSRGDYYVVPAEALEQFRATPPQRQVIDELTREEEGTGFYSEATAAEKSRQADWASENKTTARARFHTL